MNMEKDYEEYITFTITASDGTEVEMAVVDEFEFEKKNYVVGAAIKDDTIDESGLYIYECIVNGDDFTVEKIKRDFDYRRIAEAYLKMEADESGKSE